jgi:membrane protein implicated in regulation of membrane protease activity
MSLYILAQTNNSLTLDLTTYWLWLIAGVIFFILEFILPPAIRKDYKFFSLIMGLSSLLIGFQLLGTTIGVNIRVWRLQPWMIAYWMVLSFAGIVWIKPLLSKHKKYKVQEATEAKTLTDILPGETGRVLYEGISWQAYCEQQIEAIAAHQKVYVLRREGNILIIAPAKIFL